MSGIAARIAIALMLVTLAVGATACSSTTSETGPPAQTESNLPAESPTEPSADESTEAPLDAQAAVDVALAVIPDSAVIEIDHDTDDGRSVWEVVVRNSSGSGTEIHIDATTGDVVKQKSEELSPYARASAPAVTASVAMATALSATPGTVEDVDLESEGGSTVWEVEVLIAGTNGRVEHYIDATTGEIIKQVAE